MQKLAWMHGQGSYECVLIMHTSDQLQLYCQTTIIIIIITQWTLTAYCLELGPTNVQA